MSIYVIHCHTGFGGLSNVWPIVSIFKIPEQKTPKTETWGGLQPKVRQSDSWRQSITGSDIPQQSPTYWVAESPKKETSPN